MAFRFRRKESVQEGVTRIASEQLESAIATLKDADGHYNRTAIHEARKSVKKTRAVLRLAQPKRSGASSRADKRLQKVGRALSQMRDADILPETFDLLREHYPTRLRAAPFPAMRRELGSMSVETRQHALLSDGVQDVTRDLDTAIDGTGKWKPRRRGFRALEPGLETAFRRARRALADARETPNDETYHTWRKRVKTHWYQVRLLEKINPKSMKRYAAKLKRLEQLLGDDHNLSVLKSCLDRVHALRERPDARAELDASIVHLQSQLRTQAHVIGAEIYGPKPAAFARTLERGWRQWRKGRPGYSMPSARAMM
jgi:CHAD domain-containing protein